MDCILKGARKLQKDYKHLWKVGGCLSKEAVPLVIGEVKLGSFEADVCSSCGEVFFTEESSDAIDKESKIMKLESSTEILIKPEGRKRLVIEII